MTAPRRTAALTPAQWGKVISVLRMAEIENAALLDDLCTQLGIPVPVASARWLADLEAGL